MFYSLFVYYQSITTASFSGNALSNAFFGQGTGPIFRSDLGCTGTENRLEACSHTGIGQHNCVHSEDAGVRCTGE